MEETSFFNEGGVSVSNARFIGQSDVRNERSHVCQGVPSRSVSKSPNHYGDHRRSGTRGWRNSDLGWSSASSRSSRDLVPQQARVLRLIEHCIRRGQSPHPPRRRIHIKSGGGAEQRYRSSRVVHLRRKPLRTLALISLLAATLALSPDANAIIRLEAARLTQCPASAVDCKEFDAVVFVHTWKCYRFFG